MNKIHHQMLALIKYLRTAKEKIDGNQYAESIILTNSEKERTCKPGNFKTQQLDHFITC